MSELQRDIEAYELQRAHLEATAMGKWVLFHDAKLIEVTESFEDAARKAVAQFSDGPYLIRQIGASGVSLPASVMFRVG
jgi:hypothetical protein